MTQDIADSLGLKDAKGAIVGKVEKDSPAAAAGLKDGDVVASVNGELVDAVPIRRTVLACVALCAFFLDETDFRADPQLAAGPIEHRIAKRDHAALKAAGPFVELERSSHPCPSERKARPFELAVVRIAPPIKYLLDAHDQPSDYNSG